MTNSPIYIAGIGISQVNAAISSAVMHELAISAGAKALLDAGITYEEVDQSVACFLDGDLAIPKSSFDSFGKTGASVSVVDCASGLHAASQSIKSGDANCVLMIGLDKDTSQERRLELKQEQISTVALVLVSRGFLTSHAYLKDSSAMIRGSTAVSPIYSRTSHANSETLATKIAIQAALRHAALAPDDINIVNTRHESNLSLNESQANSATGKGGRTGQDRLNSVGYTGLSGLCELVWQLRGWARDRSIPGVKNCLQLATGADGTAYVTILCRADRNPAPKWEQVEHLRDGRERVGHNPAIEAKSVSFEDWAAVKSRDEFVSETTRKRLSLPVKGGDRAALARL